MEITKEFMKDFRAADQVVVRFFGTSGKLELSKHKNNKEVKMTSYEFIEKYANADEQSFWYMPYKEQCTIGILRYLLKPGDIVRFYAYKNGTEYLKKAGLNYDQLCISVERRNKQIIPRMVLNSSLCPNNSARAIQPF